jgi:pyridoxine kinase
VTDKIQNSQRLLITANLNMKTVLSIQSHVVHGYVGNRAATFPLQIQGWDVDVLNTVQLSNNTAYGSWTGQKLTAQHIEDLYSGLVKIDMEYDALLTGYAPTAESVMVISRIGQELKEKHKNMIWLLDPVMGDDGELYVSKDVIPIYQQVLKSGAVSLITPNHYEVELLTGVLITDFKSARAALEIFYEKYNVDNIVISSIPSIVEGRLITIGATSGSAFYFEYPKIRGYFTGTGDLFAALLLNKFHKFSVGGGPEANGGNTAPTNVTKIPLALGLQEVLAVMQSVLNYTAAATGDCDQGIRGDTTSMKKKELRLVECRDTLYADSHVEAANFVIKPLP